MVFTCTLFLLNLPIHFDRFLKRVQHTGVWEEVGDDTAREKASQVLRDAVAGLFEGKDVSPVALSATSASLSAPVTREEHEQHYAARGRASRPRPDYHESSARIPPPQQLHRHDSEPSVKRRRHSSDTHPHYDPRYSLMSSTSQQQQQVVGYSPIRRHTEQDYHPPVTRSDQIIRRSTVAQSFNPPPARASQYAEQRGQHSLPNLAVDEFDLFNGELLDSDVEEEAQQQQQTTTTTTTTTAATT